MNSKRLKKRSIMLVTALLLTALASGCIQATPQLVGEPTPAPTPTPTLPPVQQEITFPPFHLDALNAPIYNETTHYRQYLSFQNMRLYEYAGDTFMDGQCVNTYPTSLRGGYELVFTGSDGVEIARAPILFGDQPTDIPSGESRIFAQIDADTRIDNLPFTLVETAPPAPVQAENPAPDPAPAS